MLNFRNYLFVFFLGFNAAPASAQADSTKTEADSSKQERHYSILDSTRVIHRKFSADQVQKLKSDPGLNYHKPPTVAESLWDRFKRWISELIGQLLRGATGTNIGRIMMYALGGALLITLIMMLLKVNAFRVFIYGGDTSKAY